MYLGKLHKFDVDSRQTGHYHPLMDQISCLDASLVLFWPLFRIEVHPEAPKGRVARARLNLPPLSIPPRRRH